MTFRTFSIPSGAAIGLVFLEGCRPTELAGRWDLAAWSIDTQDVDLDYYRYWNYGYASYHQIAASLELDDHAHGDLAWSYEQDGGWPAVKLRGEVTTAKALPEGGYALSIRNAGQGGEQLGGVESGDELDLTCQLADDAMTCEGGWDGATGEVQSWSRG